MVEFRTFTDLREVHTMVEFRNIYALVGKINEIVLQKRLELEKILFRKSVLFEFRRIENSGLYAEVVPQKES